MWVKWYRRGVLIVLVAFMILGGSYCFLEWKQGQFEQEVSTSQVDENLVIPGGMPVGLYLETDGVMVLGTEAVEDEDGTKKEPAKHLVKAGDYIVGVDDNTIGTKKELQQVIGGGRSAPQAKRRVPGCKNGADRQWGREKTRHLGQGQ